MCMCACARACVQERARENVCVCVCVCKFEYHFKNSSAFPRFEHSLISPHPSLPEPQRKKAEMVLKIPTYLRILPRACPFTIQSQIGKRRLICLRYL